MSIKPLFAATLLALAAGCSSPPADLDRSLQRPTLGHKYVVALQAPNPPAAINQLHDWEVRVTSPAGQPVVHARIGVDGGMPQHGHGLPTAPQVTRALGNGDHLVEGVKFNMGGWWVVRFAIASSAGTDTVTFNLGL